MEPTKICSECAAEKPLSDFYFRKDRQKYRNECADCYREKAKGRSRLWRLQNPGRQLEAIREWHSNNVEHSKKTRIAWKKKSGPAQERTRIANNLRTRVVQALKGAFKAAPTLKLLGCTIAEFRAHLEKQFQSGMSWENYGRKGWHIDHKKPCAKFDLTNPAQQRECFHYTNLQPLWATDNLKKNKYA